MNYLKYKARCLVERLDPERPQSHVMDRIEELSPGGGRQEPDRAGQPAAGGLDRQAARGANFFELVSDGNMSLMRAVEKFDYARGNKFSTYASWAIMKNFARTIPDEHSSIAIGSARARRRCYGAPRTAVGPVRAGNRPDPARGAGRQDPVVT